MQRQKKKKTQKKRRPLQLCTFPTRGVSKHTTAPCHNFMETKDIGWRLFPPLATISIVRQTSILLGSGKPARVSSWVMGKRRGARGGGEGYTEYLYQACLPLAHKIRRREKELRCWHVDPAEAYQEGVVGQVLFQRDTTYVFRMQEKGQELR